MLWLGVLAATAVLAQAPAPARTSDPSTPALSTPALPLVVVDPGHGGAQSGAVGVCGLQEKDVTLAIAKELERVLAATGRTRVLLTRTDDAAVSLEDRARVANDAGAVLFMAIHANASDSGRSRGFEVYFLSRNAADQRIAQLARVENDGAVLTEESSDTVERILDGLRMQATHRESQQLAMHVHRTLAARLGDHGRGVMQAPFIVLKRAEMAAVLVEVAFLTNADECKKLTSPEFQHDLVQALGTAVIAHLRQLEDEQARPIARRLTESP